MCDHLAEEEKFIPGALREHFTEEEEGEIVQKIIQSLGLSGNKLALPWILEVPNHNCTITRKKRVCT